MKIKSLQLKNFKRFTDLTLQGIPENAKLVLLIGSNGSGKSSVFDSFGYLANQNNKVWQQMEEPYYRKSPEKPLEIVFETFEYGREGIINDEWKKSNKLTASSFYGRTSFRQIPRIRRTQLGSKFDIEHDSDRPNSFIERDERFENDLEHIFGKLLREYFVSQDKSEIYSRVINPINEAFKRIFGENRETLLQLENLIPPIEGKIADIKFNKGNHFFHYNYLSAGEKEVFNILVNLVARREYYQNTLFYFDEIDLHLNTRLQYNFLKELVENWIPDNCQLWTASHSLGFIQFAKESNIAEIFEFDDYNFDEPKILTPEPKDNPNLYQIAVDKDFLPSLFEHFNIIFVENKDKVYYASVGIKNTVFVPENGRNGVYHKVKSGEYGGIVDRDFLTDEDISEIESQYKSLKILRYYSIENYLYHPDNLLEFNAKRNLQFDKNTYIEKLIQEKNSIKDSIIPNLSLKRTEYPYFGEPDFNGKAKQNRFKNKQENADQSGVLSGYLNSNIFEDFYKILPMKSYATHISERQNISKLELSKTEWFKNKIEELIIRK